MTKWIGIAKIVFIYLHGWCWFVSSIEKCFPHVCRLWPILFSQAVDICGHQHECGPDKIWLKTVQRSRKKCILDKNLLWVDNEFPQILKFGKDCSRWILQPSLDFFKEVSLPKEPLVVWECFLGNVKVVEKGLKNTCGLLFGCRNTTRKHQWRLWIVVQDSNKNSWFIHLFMYFEIIVFALSDEKSTLKRACLTRAMAS